VQNGLRQAEVETGRRPGVTAAESADLREARKQIRLLEQENEGPTSGLRRTCGRRTCREEALPARERAAAEGIPVALTCRVLKLARHPYYRWLPRGWASHAQGAAR
jgi:DNA invertase Pin-like site-specific DNA recombinase